MTRPSRRALVLGTGAVAFLSACGGETSADGTEGGGESSSTATLTISAIPDQDPEKLDRLYPSLASYLSSATGADVQYVPVTDYAAEVVVVRP